MAGYPNYEIPKATGKPSMDILISPVVKRPIIALAVPLYDRQGKFAGIASTALETTGVAGFLTLQTHGQGQAYLVSDTGKAIAHPDARLVASFADLSATAPVAKALDSGDPDSSITYTGKAGEQLAGYARVPGLNWIVVVERPSSEALAGIRSARSMVFGVLLLSVLATAAAGWWVAARLVRPLAALASAATALASGDSEAPLPRTRIIETDTAGPCLSADAGSIGSAHRRGAA